MSTTFEVYPRNVEAPSFQQILELGAARIRQQLLIRGIHAEPKLAVTLRMNQTHEVLPLNISSQAIWNASEYAWFSVCGVGGGTDVDYRTVGNLDLEYWSDIVSTHPPAIERRSEVMACLSNGVYWSFRRSMGQPAIINFAYGILAGTLAELTDGFVYSDDSAWDYERFPAKAEEVYEWYFNPAKALHQTTADWASRCLTAIRNGNSTSLKKLNFN